MMKSSIIIYLLLLVLITTAKESGIGELQKKWFGDGKGRFKWSFGCSFPNGSLFALDVDEIRGNHASTCPSLCYKDNRCTHFSFSNGYCHLKVLKLVDASPTAAIYNNPGGLCGFVVERPNVIKNWMVGDNGKARWFTGCDYPNAKFNVLRANKLMIDMSKCGAHCLSVKNCTHFTWTLGTCFVKDYHGVPIVQVVDNRVIICGFIPERLSPGMQQTSSNNLSSNVKSNLITPPPSTLVLSTNPQQRASASTHHSKMKTNIVIKEKRVLLFHDEFFADLNSNKNWNHVTGVTSTDFQYYTNNKENSYVKNGILFIKPTLTVDRYGDDFLKKGYLDLIEEGCDPKAIGKRCIISSKHSDDIINPIASATITTEKSFNFTFGTVEIRAKMPKGDWISTGISLLPVNNAYGPWPLSGEIEFLRVNSNRKINCSNIIFGRQRATSTINWGPSTISDPFSFQSNTNLNDQSPDLSADFHIFRMEWTPTGFKFFVDGKMTDAQLNIPEEGLWKLVVDKDKGKKQDHPWRTGSKIAPFDQPFYLSVSVSVGGSSLFPDSCAYDRSSGKPWSSSDSKPMQKFWDDIEHWLPTWKASENKNALQIDYIRVYGQ